MKLLLFQARRFRYAPFASTAPEPEPEPAAGDLSDAVVAFVHAETKDVAREARVLSRALRQIKWLGNKRRLRNVALHSFAHLSSSKADPEFARRFLETLTDRLAASGYTVASTPFGYTCEWELSVYGDTLAKVFVEF